MVFKDCGERNKNDFCEEVVVTVTIRFESRTRLKRTGNWKRKLDVGFRNDTGKYITRVIKVNNSTVSEYTSYLR